MSEPLTRQEMFDRAVIGLRSQGFTRCLHARGGCAYADGAGRHCAWGWVDTELPYDQALFVAALARDKIGLAATLDHTDLEFVVGLQVCHDAGIMPDSMERRLRALAITYDLIFPESET